MSNWNRLYEACKEATGDEITDIYDAHLVVEKLDNQVQSLNRKLLLKDQEIETLKQEIENGKGKNI